MPPRAAHHEHTCVSKPEIHCTPPVRWDLSPALARVLGEPSVCGRQDGSGKGQRNQSRWIAYFIQSVVEQFDRRTALVSRLRHRGRRRAKRLRADFPLPSALCPLPSAPLPSALSLGVSQRLTFLAGVIVLQSLESDDSQQGQRICRRTVGRRRIDDHALIGVGEVQRVAVEHNDRRARGAGPFWCCSVALAAATHPTVRRTGEIPIGAGRSVDGGRRRLDSGPPPPASWPPTRPQCAHSPPLKSRHERPLREIGARRCCASEAPTPRNHRAGRWRASSTPACRLSHRAPWPEDRPGAGAPAWCWLERRCRSAPGVAEPNRRGETGGPVRRRSVATPGPNWRGQRPRLPSCDPARA